MQLSDYIGQTVLMLIPFLHPKDMQEIKLLGVESGGIWIQSQSFTNAVLQKAGVTGAPKTGVFFVPYHGISLTLVSIEESALNEKAFGV